MNRQMKIFLSAKEYFHTGPCLTCEAPASPPAIVPSLSNVKNSGHSPHVSLQNFSIMTATFQTDLFTFALDQQERQLAAKRAVRARRSKWHYYQVVVQNFDLEEETFYIDATDPVYAAEEAQRLYDGDIYNIFVYDVTGI